MAPPNFKPALIIVDLQEDFCPPDGSLAVTNGRDTVNTINKLLNLPFVTKIATKDWHPQDHVSFASNHAGKQPFTDFVTVINPGNEEERYETRLWPVHCVQGTKGAELIPELDIAKVDKIVEKGLRKEVEMYSAFYDPFESPRCSDSGLAGLLKEKGITDVYVVGLAFDYCVKSTAVDAAKEGFRTVIVEEGTSAVDPGNLGEVMKELQEKGVRIVKMDGDEVRRVGGV